MQHLLPAQAAVGGFVQAPVAVALEGQAHSRSVDGVGACRVYDNFGNNTLVFQAEVLPALAAVEAFPYAVADKRVAADIEVAGADVHDVRVLRVEFDVADGEERLVVENGGPGLAAIGRFPNAPLRIADVDDIRVGGVYLDSVYPRSDITRPLHRPGRVEARVAAAVCGGLPGLPDRLCVCFYVGPEVGIFARSVEPFCRA